MSNENTNSQNNNNNKKRDFILDGKISEETTRKLAEKIIEVNRYDDEQYAKDDNYIAPPINIIVNTYGGSVYDANFLIGTIETSTTPVHTICHGKAMSAGFAIFLSGHLRFATTLACFMYHDASMGLHNNIEGLKEDLKHYEALRDMVDSYIISKCDLPKSLMDETKRVKENLYLFASQALKYGIIHEIIKF